MGEKMLKINLNELKKYKVFTNEGRYDKYKNEDEEYYPDRWYLCGFIEDIYINEGKIVFKIYGYDYSCKGKMKYSKHEIDIKNINSYISGFIIKDEENEKNEYKEYYEYTSINIYDKYDTHDYETRDITGYVEISEEVNLYKDIDFKFIMRRFYEAVPPTFICDVESAMLLDEKVKKIVKVPKGYEFGSY